MSTTVLAVVGNGGGCQPDLDNERAENNSPDFHMLPHYHVELRQYDTLRAACIAHHGTSAFIQCGCWEELCSPFTGWEWSWVCPGPFLQRSLQILLLDTETEEEKLEHLRGHFKMAFFVCCVRGRVNRDLRGWPKRACRDRCQERPEKGA